MKSAPLVRALFSLDRGQCAIEQDGDGSYLSFRASAKVPGKATAYFLAIGGESESEIDGLQAEQVSSEKIQPANNTTCRLFLAQDLEKGLRDFAGGTGKHQLVLDLGIEPKRKGNESRDTSTSCSRFEHEVESKDHVSQDRGDEAAGPKITRLRTYFKIDGTSVQVLRQLVQVGQVVKRLDVLYGTLPNPRQLRRADSSHSGTSGLGDADGGECVICLSRPREVVILHCKHVCLCTSCAKITSSTWSFQCPVCRGRVAAMVNLQNSS